MNENLHFKYKKYLNIKHFWNLKWEKSKNSKEIELQNNKWFALQQLDDVSKYVSKEKLK